MQENRPFGQTRCRTVMPETGNADDASRTPTLSLLGETGAALQVRRNNAPKFVKQTVASQD
jgi:hypothetical protein